MICIYIYIKLYISTRSGSYSVFPWQSLEFELPFEEIQKGCMDLGICPGFHKHFAAISPLLEGPI